MLDLAEGEDPPETDLHISPEEAAEKADLRYVNDDEPGIRRRKSGTGFTYTNPQGKRVTDKPVLARIRSLAIPPAYVDVWICADEDGHIQATGRDARGRKQYRYHPRFREVRDSNKYERLIEFAEALPQIRARVTRDLAKRELPREKILATIVRLLDTTLIRIGNASYAEQNKSFGLTTLRNRHVVDDGNGLRLVFKGKSGKEWKLRIKDRRVARVIRTCQEVRGQHLFQYLDEDGERRVITSADVNEYLHEIGGAQISAKDFRTWAGTVLAVVALREYPEFGSLTQARRHLRKAISEVAARLGNTVAVCRKCYIHPAIVDLYLEGELAERTDAAFAEAGKGEQPDLETEEIATLALLKAQLGLHPV
jgi:DNA topoisomerase I